jgi:hypothetical protein
VILRVSLTIVDAIVYGGSYLLTVYPKTAVKRCYLVTINKNSKMLHLLDSQITQFFEQYEQYRQFDRRLVGDLKDKDKSKEIGKSEPYRYQKAADSKLFKNYI